MTDHAPDTGGALTVDAVFNAAGQVTSEKKTRPGLLGIPTVTTTSYTHDGNGNRTKEQTGTAITEYTYTPDDRLASVDQGLREVSYEYDGLGRGLQQSVSSLLVLQNRTEQVWDGMVVVAQDSTTTGATSLVRDVSGDVGIQSTTGLLGAVDTRWGLTDRLGSTIGQAQGSKIGQLAEYSDWGMPTFGTAGWNSRTGYTGELGDTTAGLWNFYARSYDPTTATWLHPDPYRGELTSPQTLGRYGYVGNNPVTATDAYGYAIMVKIKGEPNVKLGAKPVVKPGDTNPKPPKGKPGKPHTPKEDSKPTARHGDTETLLAVLDTIGTVAGFAAWIPGPQQPVLAALAAIAGAAAAFTRCSTGGINADCLVDVAFAALGPIGRGMKSVIGPIVKQALGGFKTVTKKVTSAAVKPRPVAKPPQPHNAPAPAQDLVRYDPDFALGQITSGGRASASQLDEFGASQGWVRSQTPSGPIKYTDGNGVVRVTIKQGSDRAPGSSGPHVEMRNGDGQRVDPYGLPVTRRSPGNHTPIEWDL